MITIKTPAELALMTKGGDILRKILKQLTKAVRPGITTEDLDKLAQKLVFSFQQKYSQANVRPSFLGHKGFPAHLCISINEEVVHGLPGPRLIKEGDLVSLDFGVEFEGWHTDSAVTIGTGKISREANKLLKVTRQALRQGIKQAKPGKTIGDIGWAVEQEAKKGGFQVVRELVGHGLGRRLHEEPLVPNYGSSGQGPKLELGMVLALEPMITMGAGDVVLAANGWTYQTADGSLSAHFEHTVAITAKGPRVLT